MAWPRHQWNYHPSLPSKSLAMIDDILAAEGNLLLWSCLGSGGIGLPYLDREAHEPIPGRFRFYGHLNDAEFCAECARRGVSVFGVLWNAQLWDFPAEFSEDGAQLLSLNITRGVGRPGRLGLSELSQDRYPALYRSMRDFFPDGLRDGDGAPIQDYLAEFKQVSLDGHDILSGWLMVPGHDHRCHTPCSNDRAYIAYAKRQIELMIDAGVGGVLIDEVESHENSLRTRGGCFCPDCRRAFRRYLRAHPSPETGELDLETFDYGAYLKERGFTDEDLMHSAIGRAWTVPLHRAYVEFVYQTLHDTIGELAAHVRAYSAHVRGQPVPVSGNLFNYLPNLAALRPHFDVLTGEKSGLTLRQDGWYRFARAFQGDRPACMIEAPSQHVLDMVEDIGQGLHDAYLLFLFEPLSQGVNMGVPYGAWLVNTVKDAIYPDMRVAQSVGRWLRAHEGLLAGRPVADVAVVYDQRGARERFVFHDPARDFETRSDFHVLSQHLCDHQLMYRAEYVSDDEPLTERRLRGYKKVLLPDCAALSPGDMAAVEGFVAGGGQAMTLGRTPSAFAAYPRAAGPSDPALLAWLRADPRLVDGVGAGQIGFQLHEAQRGFALHVVNYHLNRATRRVEVQAEVRFTLAWTPSFYRVVAYGDAGTTAELRGRTLILRNVGIYTVVRLSGV